MYVDTDVSSRSSKDQRTQGSIDDRIDEPPAVIAIPEDPVDGAVGERHVPLVAIPVMPVEPHARCARAAPLASAQTSQRLSRPPGAGRAPRPGARDHRSAGEPV